MKEIEALLQQEPDAGMPEPPDVRYTIAAVRRRMGRPVLPPPASGTWAPVLAALATGVAVTAAALRLGVASWWLLAFPLIALCTSPILFRKGV